MPTTAKTEIFVNLAPQPSPERILSSAPLVSSSDTKIAVGYQTIHQTPWYLRLKVSRLGDDVDYAQRLLVLVQAIECVAQVRISPAAKSIAVEFSPLSDNQIDRARTAAIAMLERALEATSEPTIALHASQGRYFPPAPRNPT